MIYVDVTDEIAQPPPTKARRRCPAYLIVHRFGPELPHWPELRSAVDVAQAFSEHPELCDSIGRMAYEICVWPSGVVEQAIRLRYWTPHALAHSAQSIAVAVIGDWRIETVGDAQLTATIEILAALSVVYPGARIVGHTDREVTGATADPAKVCPGPGLDLGAVRLAVGSRLAAGTPVPPLAF